MASAEGVRFEIVEEDDETSTPVSATSFVACNLCNHTLLHGKDVFLYRDRVYCSEECRLQLIIQTKIKQNPNSWKKPRIHDANPPEETQTAWLEKFHSRKWFRGFDKETASSLEDAAFATGLGFVIGASTSTNKELQISARQRKISSPSQVNRSRKYSNQRALYEKRKLKRSSEHLLSQNVIREASSAEFLLQGQDHVINIDYPIDQCDGSCQTDSAEWNTLLTTLILEASAAFFDQVSSPNKPYYALIGAIMSLIALAICVGQIVYKAKKAKVTWRRKGRICWLYHPFPHDLPFGSLVDCFGLACAVVQCIFSLVQYACFVRRNDNPIKLCAIPVIFASCLFFSRLIKNQNGL